MRTLEHQLKLGGKLYNVATVHALVAELKEQHDTIIAEKDKRIAKLETEKAALKDALVIVRDALLETTARCGAGYDWNADPDQITLKQGDAFAKASDAFALDIYV